jgi:hypothetical protein
MSIVKIALTVVGIIMVLMGLVWMGQGSGYFPYPETSPMINQSPWIWRGALLAVIGIGVAWAGRRLSR